MYFISSKGRMTGRKKNRQKPFMCWFTCQIRTAARLNPGARCKVWVFHICGGDPITWAIPCLPGCTGGVNVYILMQNIGIPRGILTTAPSDFLSLFCFSWPCYLLIMLCFIILWYHYFLSPYKSVNHQDIYFSLFHWLDNPECLHLVLQRLFVPNMILNIALWIIFLNYIL